MMFSDSEVESLYLGVPFEKAPDNGNGTAKRGSGTCSALIALPPVMSEDEVDRLFLGLPLIAA
jgi:hypothetical protein